MLKSIKRIGNEILEIVNYLKGLFKKEAPTKKEEAPKKVEAEVQLEEAPKKPKRKYYHKHKPKAK